ncbi:nucleotide-diphosphate-sugar epimerase [Actinocatenispora thailandica]|uniref:Nucleotide-diphosphate-sugar epimerase n=1 Tax=Actinocatenispora thailandica TaxID=227318 RepID=A0A7R7HZA6_9ACTN|nr:nucleotide-diphosphate-sugar epimerase [Actinocatenispora thailandica]
MTGGTGVLGRALVERLKDRAEVRVLSRREGLPTGSVRGDLETGIGLAQALDGVDAIAHCATSADYRHPERDVAQTRRLLDERGDRPLTYISIVGVDRIPFGYYRAKLNSELAIAQSGAPWTVLRTTQFHDLVLRFLRPLTRPPVAVVPKLTVQPVDVGEVAGRMADLVLGEPAGRVPDMGGPEVTSLPELMRTYLSVTGLQRRMLQVPVRLPGRVMAAFRDGAHLAPDHPDGRVTFAEYLESRRQADGTVTNPY